MADMSELSLIAQRILEHLYDEKNPQNRTADVIGEALGLSETEWETALSELFRNDLVSTQGKRAFKLTTNGVEFVVNTRKPLRADIIVEGDVGPGAVVGSGQVQAVGIAGGDMVTEGSPSGGRHTSEEGPQTAYPDTRPMRGAPTVDADFMTRAVLTLDIVDFSLMESQEQIKAIRALIKMLHQAIPENQDQPSARIWSPSGDGGSLTFWNNIYAALDTAVALSKILNAYNKTPDVRPFLLRVGLHSGPVTKERDFDDRENIWGEGINISARIVGLAKPGQILVSEEFYKHAQLYVPRPGWEVTSIGKWWVKHDKSLVVYNIYTADGAGLPSSEVEEWYGPFHYPLAQAIRTYEAMMQEQTQTGPAFRAAVLAKRLLDLAPGHEHARTVLESISRLRFPKSLSTSPPLYDIFFSELSPSALLHFFQNAEFKAFQKGDIIAKEGDLADSLMMVVSGEIIPFIGGKRLKERDPEHLEREREIVFHEGHITGEMGLFNPGGTRTATLQASRNTITLTLNYRFVQVPENVNPADSIASADFANRVQIQRRIWQYYCERTVENKIYAHPLFQELSSAERNRLNDSAKFLPAQFGQAISLSVEDIWNSWVIVVAGAITLYTKDGNSLSYGPGDCVGPIRLVVTGEMLFSKVEVAPNTHLVSFPWKSGIQKLILTSEGFRNACLIAGGKDKARLGLI